jgi:hypothetical protein
MSLPLGDDEPSAATKALRARLLETQGVRGFRSTRPCSLAHSLQFVMEMSHPWIVIASGRDGLVTRMIDCACLLAPLDHVLIVTEPANDLAVRAQLAEHPEIEIVAQERHLDTGPQMLVALARILERDPLGSVVFLPSGCWVLDPVTVARALGARTRDERSRITVLGMGSSQSQHAGAWSSLIAAGPITAFWDLARRHLPMHALLFERYIAAIGTIGERVALSGAYRQMTPANFTDDLLANARPIAVIRLSPAAVRLVDSAVATAA